MIDKYLRNDSPKERGKYLLKKKNDEEIEEDYNKYLKKDDEVSNDEEDNGMDNLINEGKFLMKSEDDQTGGMIEKEKNRVDIDCIEDDCGENHPGDVNRNNNIIIDTIRGVGDTQNMNTYSNFNKHSSKNSIKINSSNLNNNSNANLHANSPLKMKQSNNLEIYELESPIMSNPRGVNEEIESNNLKNNENNLSADDFLDNNYQNFENIYLNEGKIKSNISELNSPPEESIPNKKPLTTIIIPTVTSLNQNLNNNTNPSPNLNPSLSPPTDVHSPVEENQCYERNEFKLKRLQEKIEEKLRSEYEMKTKKKEKEIETKAKSEFEQAMGLLKRELENNLEDEKRKMEEDFKSKWNEKYEDLLIDCKSKLRDDKEQKLIQSMYQKLKPSVEKEIYKNEYIKVEEKIKRELEGKLNEQIQAKKMEEVERVKRKLEYFTKVKLEEMENSIKNKCKEEIEAEMKKEVEKKEKEIKTNYLRKFENFKNSLEKQLKDEYESKKKELTKEIDEMKAKVYRQKCAEKLKMSKLSNMKINLTKKEKMHFENAEKLEKALQNQTQQQFNNNSKSFYSERERNLSNMNLSNSKLSNSKVNSGQIQVNHNQKENNDDYYLDEADSYADYESSKINIVNTGPIAPHSNKNLTKITEEEHTNNNTARNEREFYKQKSNYRNNNSVSPNHVVKKSNISITTSNNFNSPKINSPNSPGRAVNLIELNKKLKSLNPLSTPSDFVSPQENRREISLLFKENSNIPNNSNQNLKENLNSLISQNSKINFKQSSQEFNEIIKPEHDYKLDSPKKLIDRENSQTQNNNSKAVDNSVVPTNNNYINKTQADEKEHIIIKNCLSLKLNSKVPISLLDFGKFLVKYIETEENYRILYEKEFKKAKAKIKKAFDDDNTSDHCLMDYIIELWDKLEVTYCNRYKILTELAKSKSHEIYHFLDRETEYLTEYFQKSQAIFDMIKNREKLKSKLQFKANRSVLSFEDKEKFKLYTNEITRKIKLFKEKHDMNIIWKGLHYEWLINYENWFYENNK